MIKPIYKLLPLAILTAVVSFFLFSGTSLAAGNTVATGNDETTTNSSCSLSEAITNISDQAATYPDCAAGDGNNDTITIPAGTITLSADLPQLTKSVTIQGAGMGQTTIDGNGAWHALLIQTSEADVTVSGLRITAFRTLGLQIVNSNVDLSGIEIDGTNCLFDEGFGIGMVVTEDAPGPLEIDISNAYVHGVDADAGVFAAFGVATTGQGTARVLASNVTVADIQNTGAIQGVVFGKGIFENANGPNGFTGSAQNITIANVHSSTEMAIGLGFISFSNITESQSFTIKNSTAVNVTSSIGEIGGFKPGVGLAAMSGDNSVGETATSNLVVTNVLLSGNSQNCAAVDFGVLIGALGIGVSSIISQGGSLSDDNSCASYFTQPSDQNNVAALAASLFPLADNGGYVPTMALKEGSPAIDSGITISGLTADARGITRPKGTAYDSGAYESPYSKPVAPTLAKSGQSPLFGLLSGAALLLSLAFIRHRRQSATYTNR